MLAGCNSNSMWKLCVVPVEVLLPTESHRTHHEASTLLLTKIVLFFSCVCSWGVSLEPIKSPDGPQGDDL